MCCVIFNAEGIKVISNRCKQLFIIANFIIFAIHLFLLLIEKSKKNMIYKH